MSAATQTEPRRGGNKKRGGNALVDKVADSLETSPPDDEAASSVVVEENPPEVHTEAASSAVSEPEPDNPFVGPESPFTRPEAKPPAPSPKARQEERLADRTQVNKPTPSAKRFGTLGKKLPGAERAKVHKRQEAGNLAYIGEYTEHDLTQSQDIESFLHKYVRPKYGPGDYQITGVDAHGRMFDMGTVTLLSPLPEAPKEAQAETPMSLFKTLFDKTFEMQQQQTHIPQPPKDPIEMLGDLFQLKKQMDGPVPEPKPSDNTLAVAMVSAATTVLTALIGYMSRPKAPDPIMAALLTKLVDDGGRKGGGDLPPPPPPPPQVDPTEQLKNLAGVLATLKGDSSNNDKFTELLLKERMTPADLMKLMSDVKSERGSDGLKKGLEDLGIMFNAINQFRAHTEPGAGAGFMDVLGALAQNRELGSVLAEMVRGRRGEQPVQQRVEVREPVRLREVDQRFAPQVTAPVLQQPQQPQQPQPQSPQPQELAPELVSSSALPEGIVDFVNRYVGTESSEDVVEVTRDLLLALAEDKNENWRKAAEVIQSYVRSSERDKFLRYMNGFFKGLVVIRLLELDQAKRVLQVLYEDFPSLVEALERGPEEGNEDGESGEDGEGDEGEGDGEGEEEDLLQLGKEEPLGDLDNG